MAGKQLSDGNPTGTTLGQDASDLIAFHGATPIAQASVATLATGATMVSIVTWAQSIIAFLRNKGLGS